MNFARFSALTIIGSAIWCWVLAWLGARVGEKLDARELGALQTGIGVDLSKLIHAVKHEAVWIVIAIVVVCILYFVAMRLTEHRHEDSAEKH
jgi:membrane protein DedA with SNARE-associated domain